MPINYNMQFLTDSQLANILHINNTTLQELVNEGKIPFKKIATGKGIELVFDPCAIDNWLNKIPNLLMDNKKYVDRFKRRMEQKHPNSLKILHQYNEHFKEPRKPKGYNLAKVKNKQLGFVYYARYIVKGKLVPSRWCTHTNDETAAAKWAMENKDRCLAEYYDRKTIKKPTMEIYAIFKKFYSENSPYLETLSMRGKTLSERTRRIRQAFINDTFVPYLRKKRITDISEIDAPFLVKFQNYLLKVKKIMPQTVNGYTSHISYIFEYLLLEGDANINPCKNLTWLTVTEKNDTGCYEIGELKGVFNKKWKNEKSYILCLLIYTTNMRNSEIEKIKVKNIIEIDKYHFIDIQESKSKNGIRIVPLHNFVYNKLIEYINKLNKLDNDYIFTKNGKKLGGDTYTNAYVELAEFTGYSLEKLKKENITFYSGRHFWKTLMNSENLGDIEEYLMGHKVSSNVAKTYNHRDKQGRKKLFQKINKLFNILDKYVFK